MNALEWVFWIACAGLGVIIGLSINAIWFM